MIAALVVVLRESRDPVAPPEEDPLIGYCAAAVERDSIELPVPSEPADAQEGQNTVPVAAGRLVLVTERMLEDAPEEARPALQTQIDAYRELVRTRDPAGFYSSALQEARAELRAIDVQSCDLKLLQMSAESFQFVGVPSNLERGRYSIQMRNMSRDAHEMVVFRRRPEFDGEFTSILRRDAQGEEAIRVTGGYAAPGGQSTVVAELPDGRYVFACFQQVGREVHWQRGMIAELTVR